MFSQHPGVVLRARRRIIRKRRARRAIHAVSHGHATGHAAGQVRIWASCLTKKGKVRDVRIDLDQLAARRLFDNLRSMGYE